MRNGTLILQFR